MPAPDAATPTGSTNMESSWIKVILDRYGPYAFGVISLLIVWAAIVRPELAENRLKTVELQKLADTMQLTAQVLDRTVTKLQYVEQKIGH